MLENDLVLERFMELHGEGLEGERLEAFRRLLAYSDGDLWDLVCGRAIAEDPAEAEVTRVLQGCIPASGNAAAAGNQCSAGKANTSGRESI
jgi:succinate dehydrogenase flavin-adding protein (antitoxin of CptAB toxin-antitoxin module)